MSEKDVVANDDPERCQGTFSRGFQCHFRSVPGSKYCPGCAAAHATALNGRGSDKALALYRLNKYQTRIQEFEDHPRTESLATEVAILRMTLEAVLNECGGDNKMLILFSGKVLETVNKIRETLVSAHKLQMSMGQLLSKNQIIQLGERLVAIIGTYVTDPQAIERISEEIVQAIDESGQPTITNQNGNGHK